MTRNAIFWGKAVPGTVLYLLAVLAPLFAVAWWVSLPGSVAAPFDWRMVYPALWDAIASLAFYFATLQFGVMSGPWYGRRLLPLMGACVGGVFIKFEFDIALAVSGAMTILILSILSAWAVFLSNGSFRHAAAWGKAAIALFGLFGSLILFSFGNTVWRMVFPYPHQARTELKITKDGQPVMVTQLGEWIKKVVTLDNVELHENETTRFTKDEFLSAYYIDLVPQHSEDWRSAGTYFLPVDNSSSPPAYWYFVNGPSLFVRYSGISKRCEEWLGPAGVTQTRQTPGFSLLKGFSDFDGVLLLCKDGIWHPNFNRNEVQKLCDLPVGEKVLGTSIFFDHDRRGDRRFDFLLITDGNMQLRASDGTLLFSIPQIPNIGDYEKIQICRKEDRSRYFLIYSGKYTLNPTPPKILLELSATGEVLQRREIANEPPRARNWSSEEVWGAAELPIGGSLYWHSLIGLRLALGCPVTELPVWKYETAELSYTLQCWSISLLFGVACAGVGQILLVRLGVCGRGRWAWTLFFVFFSYAGLLVLAIMHEWPRRQRCASCGRMRSIERTTCAHCGGTWPTRVLDGAEIFEAGIQKKT